MEPTKEIRLFGLPVWQKREKIAPEQRSNPTGVSTLKNPSDWLRNALGSISLIGENVTPEQAMRFPVFAGCVKVIAETVAMLPCKPMVEDANGNTRVMYDHPNYQLLHERPNPMMNSYVWKETMQTHAGMHGDAYSIIIRDSDSKPIELRLIENPDEVQSFAFENRLWHKVKGIEMPIPDDDMFHITSLSYNGLHGKKPTEILSNVLGLALAVEKYGSLIFSKGGSKRVAFRSPGKVDPQVKKNIQESWVEKYGGTDNQHYPGFIEGGLELIEVGMDPMNAQFIELKKFLIAETTRFFRVQLHLVQHMEQSTNNNIEKQSREFIDYTMMPWLIKWEKEADIKLYSTLERRNMFTKFNVKSLLRGDFRTQTEGLIKLIQWGVYSPNDALKILDENTYEGGDLKMFPQNMTTVDKVVNPQNQE